MSTAVAVPLASVTPPLTGPIAPAEALKVTVAFGTRLLFESLTMAVTVEPVATVFAADGSCAGLTISVTEGTTVTPLLLLELAPLELLLDEEPDELLLDEDELLPGKREMLGPPPPQPTKAKENRTAAQAWAIV